MTPCFFFLAGLVAFQKTKATIDFSFWVSPGTWSETIAGQTCIQNLSWFLSNQSKCNQKFNRKTENLQMKNPRFQSRRLTTDHAIIRQAWPSPARSSQILAIKKETLLGVLATCTNYREAFTNLLGGSGLPKRKLPKSGIQFFRLLVFTESQVLPGTFNSRKKNRQFSKGKKLAKLKKLKCKHSCFQIL